MFGSRREAKADPSNIKTVTIKTNTIEPDDIKSEPITPIPTHEQDADSLAQFDDELLEMEMQRRRKAASIVKHRQSSIMKLQLRNILEWLFRRMIMLLIQQQCLTIIRIEMYLT